MTGSSSAKDAKTQIMIAAAILVVAARCSLPVRERRIAITALVGAALGLGGL